MRTIVLMVMGLSAVQGTARTADAPTVLLENARVRVLRLSTSGPLTDHPAAVIVPLEDGAFGKTGDAFWSGDAPVRPTTGPGVAASLVVIELKAPSSSGLPALPVAAGSKPGEGTFVGLSFKPLFENARVAVIRGRMEKGATEGVHTHASDIVLVHLSGGVIEDTANGQTKVNRWTHGDVELETRGSSHSARNLGPAVDAVLVTLKP
jgi:quercetin dioxygenase-like cupin family protein